MAIKIFFAVHAKLKRVFCLLATPTQISFLTISNENFFFKTPGTRLRAIVTPYEGLEEALVSKFK